MSGCAVEGYKLQYGFFEFSDFCFLFSFLFFFFFVFLRELDFQVKGGGGEESHGDAGEPWSH